ncbi:hypothetical protein D3C87_1136530 [compost metagenome]|jgi:hypothetical protein
MIRVFKFLILFPLVVFSQDKATVSLYPAYIGDIEFNKGIDDESFKLCFEKHIFQYFNDSHGLEYEGEKVALEREFAKEYKSKFIKNETGSIRINFVVNCNGKTDRFRLIAMDENYIEKQFESSITEQLLRITKSLKGWKGKQIQGHAIDYYQYLIFKIENGQLKEILP